MGPCPPQARWFVKHKLAMLRDLCDEHAGYGLLLVGHSLGAGRCSCCWGDRQPSNVLSTDERPKHHASLTLAVMTC